MFIYSSTAATCLPIVLDNLNMTILVFRTCLARVVLIPPYSHVQQASSAQSWYAETSLCLLMSSCCGIQRQRSG